MTLKNLFRQYRNISEKIHKVLLQPVLSTILICPTLSGLALTCRGGRWSLIRFLAKASPDVKLDSLQFHSS